MQKKFESKPKNFGLKKGYFWGHPVIQAVEAKKFDFDSNFFLHWLPM